MRSLSSARKSSPGGRSSSCGEGFGGSDIRCGDADDFATGFGQLDSLAHGGFHVEGVRNGHGLDADGVVPTHADVAHHYLTGRVPYGTEA